MNKIRHLESIIYNKFTPLWTIFDSYPHLINKIYTVKKIEKSTLLDIYPHYQQQLLLNLLLNK